MKPKIAVIGVGHWGKNLVRVFSELGCLAVKCDKIFEGPPYSLRDSLNESEISHCSDPILIFDNVEGFKVDAVAIATPSETHFQIAKDALLAGKDVFVEKPMCLTIGDAYNLVELAEKQNKILMVGHVLLYDPVIQDLKQNLDKLGKIEYIFATRMNNGRVRENETVWWSLAPHDIALMIYLLDAMPTVQKVHGDRNCTQTMLSFHNGTKGYIQVSWLHPYKVHKFVVRGDKDFFVYTDGRHYKSMEPSNVMNFEKEPLRRECQHFIDCIISREKPLTDGEHGIKVVRILQNCAQLVEGK